MKDNNTDQDFKFNNENLKLAEEILKKYPKKQSAILPLLDLAQRQNSSWLSPSCISYISDYLEIPYIRAYEIATFYTMFNLNKVGKYHIQLCGTTPCWLKGAENVKKYFEEYLSIKCGQTTQDALFTLSEVECLAACTNGPVAQINDKYYEDITDEKVKKIIDALRAQK